MDNHVNRQPDHSSAVQGGRTSLSDRVRSLRIPDRPAAQPVGRWWLPWLLCLMFAAAAGILAMRPPRVEGPPADAQAPVGPVTPSGGSASQDRPYSPTAGPNEGISADTILLESKGYVLPVQSIKVSPKVGGTVLQLNIREGQQVARGDVLAELERIEYESDHKRVEAMANAAFERWWELEMGHRKKEIKQAKAELDEHETRLTQLNTDWKRNLDLRAKNSLSIKELEQSETDYLAMRMKVERMRLIWELMVEGPRRERIDAAFAEWRQNEAEVVKAKWRLDNCTVRAPISGTILSKKAEEGDIVNPAAFNISATLCELADLYNLEVDLSIAERDVSKVFAGQLCKIRPEAFLNRTYWGTVSRLMPTADRAKGSIPVRVKVQIAPRAEDVRAPGSASAFGLFGTPLGMGTLTGATGLAGAAVERQAQFLRPEMGVLVSFFNARSDLE